MYTDERNILDVKGQSLIHALAPLFTIHRELKSKSVWQRGDVDNLCTGKLLIHSYQISYSIHIFSYLLHLDKVQ